jgi:subtilisin family serine protease
MVYANFMHGSHVTGINVGGDTSLNAIAVKLLATEHISLPVYKNKNMLSRWLFKKLLAQAAQANVDSLATVVDYIKGHEAKVMNGSFGVGYNENTKAAIAQIYKTVFLATPSEDDVEEFTMYFLNELLVRGEKFVANSPDLLFVFAAGNDGTNNDFYPSYPTNLSKFENVIAVAATMDERAIASFSNRGVAMVDVAAPGVAISSSVPGDNYLRVSGTSQAAPYVARIAGLVRDINPSLKPADVKKIIAATVDAKTWLADRVKSGGLVNLDRATSAARFSLHWGIDESIRAAFDVIPTRPDLGTDIKTQMTPGLFLPIMPTGITWPF